MAIINDSFTRANEALDASATWTKYGGTGGSELSIVSNQLALSNAAGGRRAYYTTDQGDPDMLVQSGVPSLTDRSGGTNTQIALRAADADNYLGLGVSQGNNCFAGVRSSGTWTEYASTGVLGSDVVALKIEAEGTDIRFYYDIGAGFVLFHTESGVTDHQTETLGGYISNLNDPGTVVWDDFELGDLASYGSVSTTGPAYTETLFDYDYFAYGNIYYFNPDNSGSSNGTGTSDANAFYTFAQINAKTFSPGDKLLFRTGTTYVVDTKMRNTTLQGDADTQPAYVGAYHLVGGVETPGLGGEARPNLDGGNYEDFDYFGSMSDEYLTGLQPAPNQSGGVMTSGSLEGIFNFYGMDDNILHLRFGDLSIRASGGRAVRFTTSESRGGLLVQNLYCEGCMTQALHVSGVYDAIIEDCFFTKADAEYFHGSSPGNRQACIAVKGTTGNFDEPQNVCFRRNVVWDTISSEAINCNSGARGAYYIDNILIDAGCVASLYLDRTYDLTAMGNIVIRTGRTAFHEFDGATTNGRDGYGIMIQNEKATGSFPWDVYNTEQDFFDYQVQRGLIAFNLVIGFQENYGFISQVSTAADGIHLGRDHGAGLYWYNNMSLDPAADHFNILSAAPVSNYSLRTDLPQRMWGNVFWTGTTRDEDTDITDRNDSQFDTIFTTNYRDDDITSRTNFDTNETTSGLTMPLEDYWDLSSNMTTDSDDWMDYDNVRSFISWMGVNPDDLSDRNMVNFRPTANESTGIALSALTVPSGNTWMEDLVDIEGNTLPATLNFGPFAQVLTAADAPPADVYYRYLMAG